MVMSEGRMPAIQSVVHFSIPVSDIERSTRFYIEIVGCRHLETVARGTMAFLDAAGTCLILVKRDPPINPVAVNNAGPPGPVGLDWEVDADEWFDCIDVIVRGAFLVSQAVVPGMIARG